MTEVLRTKLIIPLADQTLVVRPRLRGRLDEAANCALTLVSAPAGSGKTTLVSAWAREQDGPVAWISLDRRDNDGARFEGYLVEALRSHGVDWPDDRSHGHQSPQNSLESTFIGVINQLVDGQIELALVLDDYHLIENPAIHAAMTFLVENLPAGARVIVSTRADPPFPLARLRGRGQLAEVRFDKLRFTPEEAAAFLNLSVGDQLAAQDVEALNDRTEGWICGLKLAALSLQGSQDPHGVIESFRGSHRYVLDYLVDEVLDKQPEQVQDFLLETSILEQLNGPLCSAVTLIPNGGAMLAALERANLFLIPLDQKRQWYRYHHLLAEVLRERLAERAPNTLQELQQRACDWYAHNKLPAEAIEHALAAGDPDQAAALIERFAEGFWMNSQVASLLQWIRAIPLHVRRSRASLSLWEAWMLLLTGPWQQVDAILEAVEANLAAGVGGAGERSDVDGRELRGMLAAVRAFRANTSGHTGEAIQHAKRALESLGKDNLNWRGAVAHILGDSYRLQGDLPSAGQAYTQAGAAGRQSGNVFSVLISLRYRAEMQVRTGALHQAEITFIKALRYARQHGAEGLSAAGTVHIGLGSLCYERGEPDRARRHLEAGLAVCEAAGHGIGLVLAHCALARLRHAAGDSGEAQAHLERAEQQAETHELQQLYWYPHSLRVLINLQEATNGGETRLDLAERWAAGWVPMTGQDSRPLGLQNLVYGRLRALRGAANGEHEAALDYLDAVVAAARLENKPKYQLVALILRARALHSRGDEAGSLQALAQALQAGKEHGFVQVFLDEGEAMCQLLQALLVSMPQHPAAGFAAQLLARFGQQDRGAERLLDKLFSPREIEVLQLMAQGCTNRQIARELVVAESTVKTHLGHIYRKLKVGNRTQALRRLPSMNLLEAN